MKNIINKLLTDKINSNEKVVLELGCGNRKKVKNSITIDEIDYPNVDICGDIFEVLGLIPDSTIDEVHSFHFIEHISDVSFLIEELARIVKGNGIVGFTAPHFSNPYYYSDPTHKTFFGLYTFCYYSDCSLFSRKVPTYNVDIKFNLEKVNLNFKTDRSFFIRKRVKYVIGMLFNFSSYAQEFYEDSLCYIFPCYEIHAILRRKT